MAGVSHSVEHLGHSVPLVQAGRRACLGNLVTREPWRAICAAPPAFSILGEFLSDSRQYARIFSRVLTWVLEIFCAHSRHRLMSVWYAWRVRQGWVARGSLLLACEGALLSGRGHGGSVGGSLPLRRLVRRGDIGIKRRASLLIEGIMIIGGITRRGAVTIRRC